MEGKTTVIVEDECGYIDGYVVDHIQNIIYAIVVIKNKLIIVPTDKIVVQEL